MEAGAGHSFGFDQDLDLILDEPAAEPLGRSLLCKRKRAASDPSSDVAANPSPPASRLFNRTWSSHSADDVFALALPSPASICTSRSTSASQSDDDSSESPRKVRRRRWLHFEDQMLRESVAQTASSTPSHWQQQPVVDMSEVSWAQVSVRVPNRSAKQCRDRWSALLSDRGAKLAEAGKREWTMAEDLRLLLLHREHNNRWVRIAAEFSDRNDNMVKSRFRVLSRLNLTPADIAAQMDRQRVVETGSGLVPGIVAPETAVSAVAAGKEDMCGARACNALRLRAVDLADEELASWCADLVE